MARADLIGRRWDAVTDHHDVIRAIEPAVEENPDLLVPVDRAWQPTEARHEAFYTRTNVYTVRDYASIIEHLVKTWNIAGRAVSGEAAQTQDDLAVRPNATSGWRRGRQPPWSDSRRWPSAGFAIERCERR